VKNTALVPMIPHSIGRLFGMQALELLTPSMAFCAQALMLHTHPAEV